MTDLDLSTLVEETVTSLKYILLECHIGRSKQKNLLKVIILHPEKEISSDDCTTVADILSRRLDIDDPFDKAYDLIVESPGLEREIKSPKEYQYFVGKEFKIFPNQDIVTKEGFFIATLINVDLCNLKFKNEFQEFNISTDQIIKAKLYCDFSKILKENKKS